MEDIFFELGIDNCKVINAYIDCLKGKKYLKFKLNKKFIITFDGFNYLQNVQKNNQTYENSLHSIIISMVALLISIYGILINNEFIKLGLILILFICMCYYTNKIFNKKYY